MSNQDKRIEAIVGSGDGGSFADAMGKFLKYLTANLKLPCEVTGTEDFNWEEIYVFGGAEMEEYEELKKSQPSFEDRYQLTGVKAGSSRWMLCPGIDLAAHVKRINDGKKFVLGLSELKVTDKKSPNFRLIDDYAKFFWNSR
jgi:hypothetical protein